MAKNRLPVFPLILVVISLFTTAMTCNLCGIPVDIGETSEGSFDTAAEGSLKEDKEPEEAIVEKDANEKGSQKEEASEAQDQESEAPAIDLFIYEGPAFSEDDGVCYFRIEAIVSGNPVPDVSFSRDDSNGAWGPTKAQINIGAPGETYTLTATAKNPEGTATDSLELSWGCSSLLKSGNHAPIIWDINVVGGTPLIYPESKYGIYATVTDSDGDDLTYRWSVSGGTIDDIYNNFTAWNTPDTGGTYSLSITADDGNGGSDSFTKTVNVAQVSLLMPPVTTEFPIVTSEGGMVDNDLSQEFGTITPLLTPYGVGDTDNNKARIAFISFDITELSGDIISSHLTFDLSNQVGDPSPFRPLKVTTEYWGAQPLQGRGEWQVLGTICEVNSPSFSADNGNLKSELLRAIEDGRNRFQIVLSFQGSTRVDNDNIADLWLYEVDDISLVVTYRP